MGLTFIMARRVALGHHQVSIQNIFPDILSKKEVQELWKDKMRKMIHTPGMRRRADKRYGVLLKSNLSVMTLLKRLPALQVKVRTILPGSKVKGNPTVIALLKRVPALRVKLRHLLPYYDAVSCMVPRALTVPSLLRRVSGLKNTFNNFVRCGSRRMTVQALL